MICLKDIDKIKKCFLQDIAEIKKILPEEDIKALDFELKDRGRENKLLTEIYLLKKYSSSGLKIRRPPRKDCVLEVGSKKYIIEVYQPDTSKNRALKDAQENAEIKVINGYKLRAYFYSCVYDNNLEEFVYNVVSNKKRKNQLSVDINNKNVLWVDISDLSLIDSILIENADHLDFYKLEGVKSKLYEWNALSGLIISIWKNNEKEGILLNKNLDDDDIELLSKGITLRGIIN